MIVLALAALLITPGSSNPLSPSLSDMRNVCGSDRVKCDAFLREQIEDLEAEGRSRPEGPLFCATASQQAAMLTYLRFRVRTNLVAYLENAQPPAASIVRTAIKNHYPCHQTQAQAH